MKIKVQVWSASEPGEKKIHSKETKEGEKHKLKFLKPCKQIELDMCTFKILCKTILFTKQMAQCDCTVNIHAHSRQIKTSFP